MAGIKILKCSYCDRKAKAYVIEHIMPTRFGGNYRAKNSTRSCRSCNALKGYYPFETVGQVKSFLRFKNGFGGDHIYTEWLLKNKLEVKLVKSV